jgi:hypothetical protein
MTDPRPRDDSDVAQDTARDLGEIAAHFGQLKGDANAYLTDPNYNTLRLRLENAHASVEAAAVEARRRVRLNEGETPSGVSPPRPSHLSQGAARARRGRAALSLQPPLPDRR